MKKTLLCILVFICALTAKAQSGGYTSPSGGGSSLPQGAGNFGQDAFVWTTACGGRTNCFQGVDDDSTDNCGAALTSFMAAINAGATPGFTQAIIEGAGIGKAYLLATSGCNIPITNPNGAALHLLATLDCEQTADNCVQLGPTGKVSEQPGENYDLDGYGGTLFGGVNLTKAGIHVEPGVNTFYIQGIAFKGPLGATHHGGFGANNATFTGACVNSSIYIDNPVAAGWVIYTFDTPSFTSATSGGCGYLNPNGSAAGTNTVFFVGNVMGGGGVAGGGTGCGYVSILDGGSYGGMTEDNIYGVAIPLRIQGIGHRVHLEQLDAAGCVASGVSADIQWGATGSSAAVGPNTITDNIGQIFTSHANNLLAQAGDSTASLLATTVSGNENAGGADGNSNLMPSNSCGVGRGFPSFCYQYGNQNFSLSNPACGSTNSGWVVGDIAAACQFSFTTANLGSSAVLNAPTFGTGASTLVTLSCEVLIHAAAGTSSTLPQCVFTYTDGNTSTTQTVTVTPTWASGTVGCSGTTTNTAGNSCKGSLAFANIAGGTTLQVSTINGTNVGTAGTFIVNVSATLVNN